MNFKEFLINQIGFTPEESEISVSLFKEETLDAKQFFLKEGDIAEKLAIVLSGVMRTFYVNENGDEVTSQFHEKGNLILFVDSFNNQTKVVENAVAVTNVQLITITNKNWLLLLEKVPKWNFICRATSDKITQALQNRNTEFQTLSAVQRYQKFCKEHPEVYKNATLGQIASYLGIDIATLSRIRKKVSL